MGNNYIFPFQMVPKNAKLILYGAGTVGLCFYKQLKTTDYAKVELWVDQNWENCRKKNLPVCAIDNISSHGDFDYIVIAIDNEKIAIQVKNMLTASWGIEENRIIYSSEYKFVEHGLYQNVQDEIKHGNYEEELQEIKAKEMLRADRLDLIVRYLLAKDIANGVENKANLSLYSRMILIRNNAYEGEGYFSEYKREGTAEYVNALKKVCLNMKKTGFDKSRFIPVGQNNVLLNGAHRTAVSLALDEDIWIKQYPDQNGNMDYGINWFEENGFNTEDKIRILRGYADLYEKCGIMLLFGPCMEQWDYLQMQLAKQMKVVGAVELDFTDNYIAFENLFREIYSDPLWRNVYIDRKVALLKMSPLKIRVLLVSDEGFEQYNLYKTMGTAKQELRDRMFFETDIAPVVMHGSDSVEEFRHLKKIILSVNNLKHLRMRAARNYSEEFINRLDALRSMLSEKGVSVDGACVCGSAGWEIYGLRNADDIDFFVEDGYRKEFGNETVPWNEFTHYTRENSIKTSADIGYTDDVIISDDNLYYMFYGLKFVNLAIMAEKKSYSERKKDIRDVRLYELFRDYAANFDDKSILKKLIEKEFYKKR